MKKFMKRFMAGLLALSMTVGSYSTAFAEPVNANDSSIDSGELALSQEAETTLAAAEAIASLNEGYSGQDDLDDITAIVKEAIFGGSNGTIDLSRYDISAEQMDSILDELLGEKNITSTVEVSYDTDDEGKITTTAVEMDYMVAMASEELKTVYNLSEEQSAELLGMYAQYLQLYEDNADMFGVQVPFNTTRDTNASPIGSLLDVASIPEEYAQAGYIGYDVLSGIIQLYYLGTQFAVSEYKDEVIAGRDEALSVLKDGMTDMQEYLAINGWLANNCQFAMDYIMDEMVEPEPAANKLYEYAYQSMYNMIHGQVYDGTYNALVDVYGEDQAKAIATQQADAYMVDVQENGGSGEQQAASTASAIVGMWGSNQVGVFVNKKAVCFGYATVYAYLMQCAHPEIYLKDGATDIDKAENWKSYTELNYKQDAEGNPVKDENGDYVWDKDADAIVDYVKIIFDADATMFGQTASFGEAHYWNAVKLDGNWYYVDPCYVDIYIECMNRDRVETDGNMNHLYFMFSDDSCRDMYDGNYKDILTLYKGIATDKTYEESWVAFVKSQPYWDGSKIYYLYDSTDLLEITGSYGNGSSSATSRASSVSDYEGLFTDTEYKIAYHDNDSMSDTSDELTALVDFTDGQVYNPETKAMEDNALIAELYAEHQEYVKEYPSIAISCAYYGNKIYFSLSNCVLSYDLATGAVTKLIEYTEVSGERDMSKGLGGLAFAMTSGDPGTNGITVENPPIADMTIKADGNMYVSVATNYGFISGKDFGQLTDYSSYGYKFAETNYEPSYNTYYNSSEENDNDEFMWSANIVGTISMSHLAGSSHSYSEVSVPQSCTEEAYTVSCCSTCGLIQETAEAEANVQALSAEGEATATFNIKVYDSAADQETEEPIKTAKIERQGTEGDPCTISADDIKAEIGTIEGYTLNEDGLNGTGETVAYGETKDITLTATKNAPKEATATLEIRVYDSEADKDTAEPIKTATFTENGPEGEERIISAEEIKEKIGTIEGYTLDEDTVPAEGKTVAYGASDELVLTASKETADATIIIKVYDSATMPEEGDEDAEEPVVVVEKTVTKNGSKGDSLEYTADEIKTAVAEDLTAKRYELDEKSLPEESIKVEYGGEAVTVELTATVLPTGKGHTYIKFDETYYTKNDNGYWNKGTSYVCIDCGHAFEVDEDSTLEDNLRSNDVVLTDEEVKAYAQNQKKVWTWSTDKTEASMYSVPTDLMGHMFDCIWENPALSSREVATVNGDCATGEFKATLKSGETATANRGAGSHTYLNQEETDGEGNVTQEAAVKWEWAEDLSTATITMLCDVCGKTHTETVTDIKGSDTAATCDESGKTTYTATVTVDDVNYISSRDVEIPALGHAEESDTKYTDNENGTHTYHCTRCDKDVTEDCVFDENHVCPKCGGTDKGLAPEAVENLKATPAGKQKVKLTWTASPEADGYLVYGISEKHDGEYGYIAVVEDGSKTTAYDTKAFDTEYNFYWVFPYSLDENGKKIVGQCPEYVYAKGTCPAVTGLKAASEAKGVQLTWNKSVDAEGYLIYGIHPGEEYKYIGMTEKATYLDQKAPADEYSYYWVYPYYMKGEDMIAGPACAKYVYGKANGTTISNLKATAMKGAIKLTWNDSGKADGYLIYVREGDGEYTFRAKTTTNATSYVDKKASTEVKTFYWVYSYTNNADGSMNVGPRSHYTYGTALK